MPSIVRRIDWHAVFADIAYLGLTGDALASRIGLRAGLLQSVAAGKVQPSTGAANRLAGLWCDLTGKAPEFLPRTSEAEGAERPAVERLDSNEQAEPAHAQLQALLTVWARISSAEAK